MKRMIVGVSAVLGCLCLGACANSRSVYRQAEIGLGATPPAGQMTVLDARERVIVSGIHDSHWVVCPDRGADVFAAASEGGSLAASLGLTPSSKQKDLSATFSSNETATALQRRVTVDLIEDARFRDCLRYLAGDLERDDWVVHDMREQDVTLALAFAELIADARPQSGATISASSEAGAQAVASLDAAYKATASATTQAKTDEAAYQKLAKKSGDSFTCDGASDQAACAAAQAKAQGSASDARSKAEHYQALKSLVGKSPDASPQAQAPGDAGSGAVASQAIAAIYADFIKHSDQLKYYCLNAMRKKNQEGVSATREEFLKGCRSKYMDNSVDIAESAGGYARSTGR